MVDKTKLSQVIQFLLSKNYLLRILYMNTVIPKPPVD